MYGIVYRGDIPPKLYQGSVDIINGQLSRRNSLNALCYQSSCMNCFSPPELASVYLRTGHKIDKNIRC